MFISLCVCLKSVAVLICNSGKYLPKRIMCSLSYFSHSASFSFIGESQNCFVSFWFPFQTYITYFICRILSQIRWISPLTINWSNYVGYVDRYLIQFLLCNSERKKSETLVTFFCKFLFFQRSHICELV